MRSIWKKTLGVIKKSFKVCKKDKNIKLNKNLASCFVDRWGKSYEDRFQDYINEIFLKR